MFANLASQRPDALFVANGAFLTTRRIQLVHLATRHAIPATYPGMGRFVMALPPKPGVLTYLFCPVLGLSHLPCQRCGLGALGLSASMFSSLRWLTNNHSLN